MAYKLQLSNGCSVHPIFHITKLQKVVSIATKPQVFPLTFTGDMEWLINPTKVLFSRKRNVRVEVFIKWEGLPNDDAS